VFEAGDTPKALHVLRQGMVKMVRPTSGGKRSICGVFGAPESFGDMPLLAGTTYPASAVACTRLEVCLVPRERLLDLLQAEPQLFSTVLRSVQEKMRLLLAKVEILSAGSVDARIASLLLHLHGRFGDELEDGVASIPIHLVRQEIAELVSTSVETVIRSLRRWEDERWIELGSRSILIRRPEELARLAGVHLQ
jgi:CRP-like cAMP-binding protein